MKTKNKLKIVVIGGGYFGTKRIQSCMELPDDCTLVGIVEPSQQRAEALAKQFDIPVAPSLRAFAGRADLAIISTPNAYHASVSIDALASGLHVLCEKPLARTFKEARSIAEAAKQYKRFVKTGSNHRFIPYIERTLQLINKGAVGRVLRINGSIGNNGSQVASRWFWNKTLSGGGTLIDNGCHLMDIILYIMNDISFCFAQTTNAYWKNAAVEDNASVIMTTRDGRQAAITSSWTKWNGYVSLEIWGDEGFIEINSNSQLVMYGNKQGKILKIYDYTKDKTISYQKEILYLKDCIQKNIPPKPDAEDGARVVQLIDAAYKSSRLKKQISV